MLFILGAAGAPVHGAAQPPGSVTASYDVRRNGLHVVQVQEHYVSADGAYRLTSDSRAVGVFALIQRTPAHLESSGRVTAQGLRPEQFDGARGITDSRRVAAEFDWSASRLTLRHDGRSDVVDLPNGTQDRLSVMYQFMFLAPDGRRDIAFPMTNGRKLDHYRYTATAGVPLETALGRLATVHLVKQRAPGETEAEIWLSPRHHYLPVKAVIVEDDGVRYEQTVRHLEVLQ